MMACFIASILTPAMSPHILAFIKRLVVPAEEPLGPFRQDEYYYSYLYYVSRDC